MVVSASRRTDIPACYPRWMLRRLQAGSVLVPNPYNPLQVSRVPLAPDVVDCIVFWTKNPIPIVEHLPSIDAMGFSFCFQFTLTPYGGDWEPGLPSKPVLEEALAALSDRWGKERVLWRYDPILLDEVWTVGRHLEAFEGMCARLYPYTNSVTISFVDPYAKTAGTGVRPLTLEEMQAVGEGIGRVAEWYGLKARACCEQVELSPYGIERGRCIDREDLELVCGEPLALPAGRGQRKGCGCCESVDIGMYDTCGNGCLYCYANRSPAAVDRGARGHRETGELLTGSVSPEAKVLLRPARSWRETQTSLFE